MKRLTCAAASFLLLAILNTARPAVASTQDGSDQFFDSGGVRIRYRIVGAGSPVVLLHGFTMTIESQWNFLIDSISSPYRLIALDIRGHGQSDKPHEPSAYGAEVLDDVARLLDHLQIESAHIVGYSMGGLIALKFAAKYPDRVSSLVVGGFGIRELDSAKEGWGQRVTALESNDNVVDALLPNPPPDVSPELLAVIAANDSLALAATLRSLPDILATTDEVARIHQPILAVVGENDERMSEVRALEEAATQAEVVVIKGRGHGDAFTTPEFVAAIELFLKRVDGS